MSSVLHNILSGYRHDRAVPFKKEEKTICWRRSLQVGLLSFLPKVCFQIERPKEHQKTARGPQNGVPKGPKSRKIGSSGKLG